MSVVVAQWGPVEAGRLQQALRLTNEAFAEKLGAAPRTIAKWHANPGMRLTLELQQALDTMLRLADQDTQLRFAHLNDSGPGRRRRGGSEAWRRRLDVDRHLASALDGLDGIRHQEAGTSRGEVEALLEDGGAARLRERARARASIDRAEAAQVVGNFYGDAPAGYGRLHVSTPTAEHATTIVTRGNHPSARLDLRDCRGEFALVHEPVELGLPVTSALTERAVQRIGEILVARTRFVDAPVYRMIDPPDGDGASIATFAVDTFARYALSGDLLEGELADHLLQLTDALPLREALLPTTDAVLNPATRICVGGAQALSAFARDRDGSSDYLLLVQERSPRVVNATGRLAAIPKCFHQPMNDAAGEVGVGRTLLRELEEELFGRAELDGATVGSAADPMHASRLSPPMRWLMESSGWDLESTGFGFNLINGNYEFAALMAVHDPAFWTTHGGTIEANWEAARLRTYSSLDRDGLTALLNEPGWSDEGLVAFTLGLRRLAELSPERVALPSFEIGVQT